MEAALAGFDLWETQSVLPPLALDADDLSLDAGATQEGLWRLLRFGDGAGTLEVAVRALGSARVLVLRVAPVCSQTLELQCTQPGRLRVHTDEHGSCSLVCRPTGPVRFVIDPDRDARVTTWVLL